MNNKILCLQTHSIMKSSQIILIVRSHGRASAQGSSDAGPVRGGRGGPAAAPGQGGSLVGLDEAAPFQHPAQARTVILCDGEGHKYVRTESMLAAADMV